MSMPRRIYTLAKELGVNNYELLQLAIYVGITGKNALSSVSDEEEQALREYVTEERVMMLRTEKYVSLRGAEVQSDAELAGKVKSDNESAPPAVLANIQEELSDTNVVHIINAISTDMMRGHDHFALVELGAVFECALYSQIQAIDNQGLRGAIEEAVSKKFLPQTLKVDLLFANRIRNMIVHRRANQFPTAEQVHRAKMFFAIAFIDLCKTSGVNRQSLAVLADSNPAVLEVLDKAFKLLA